MSEATIPARCPVDVLVGRLRTHAEAHEYIANADPEQKQWMNDLYDAADAIERAPRWRDVADELPQEAQEVLFVRGGKTVHGAWIGGIFWHSNQKMAAAYWMPLPLPPNAELAQQTGLTAQQVRDNANAAVADRLVIKGKDCVTGSLGYQITSRGRLWNDGQLQNARATLSETAGSETAQQEPETGGEPIAETSQELTDFLAADSQGLRESIEAALAAGFEVDAPPGGYWPEEEIYG